MIITKKELIEALDGYHNDTVVICRDEDGGWDNVERVENDGCAVAIVFGGGSPFSDERGDEK